MASMESATAASPRPQRHQTAQQACTKWLTRALFPKVMEFKVICRESEKHEFMPVVYLIERSANWKKRIPHAIEQQLIEDYVAPLLPLDNTARESDLTGTTGFSSDELALIGKELQQRTELIHSRVTQESQYKMALLVDYAAKPSLHKSPLFQVVRQLLTTLSSKATSYKRALFVPVSVHFCTDGNVNLFDVRRYAGVRFGSPVLVEQRDVEIFQDGPLEYTHHVVAKLSASLKMPPPQTAAQMEILRLSRSLHVYCARVYRDDCFSRRQIASMNEEILQIHFRTRNHPDMHTLKTKMQQYCLRLQKWNLRDEDINTATVAAATPKTPVQVACVIASILLRLVATPWRLLLSGVGDFVFRCTSMRSASSSSSSAPSLSPLVAAMLKCLVALLLCGVVVRGALFTGNHWLAMAFVVLLVVLQHASSSLGGEDVAAHWKKIQFYVMDAAELYELQETRVLLARRIHAIVAQYVSADLPPPVLQSLTKKCSASEASEQGLLSQHQQPRLQHQYSLNVHHKIFINTPRSFPLKFAEQVHDRAMARRAVYAPKMLRDEVWRTIYGTLAPANVQFTALLADNKGDSLPMDRLLQTPFFDAVLTAYMIHYKRSQARTDSESSNSNSESSSESESDEAISDELEQMIAASDDFSAPAIQENAEEGALGSYQSVQEIVEAALELAQEEEELSS